MLPNQWETGVAGFLIVSLQICAHLVGTNLFSLSLNKHNADSSNLVVRLRMQPRFSGLEQNPVGNCTAKSFVNENTLGGSFLLNVHYPPVPQSKISTGGRRFQFTLSWLVRSVCTCL